MGGDTVRIAIWRGLNEITELRSSITYYDGELHVSRFEARYRGPLAEAWRRLGAVRAPSAETLADVLAVLRETVPHPGAVPPAAPPPAEWNAKRIERRPTAANPRAFKGTKYQPPKAPSVPAFDLRPYLCAPAFFARAIEPLLRQSHGSKAIDKALNPWPRPRSRFDEDVNALVSHLEVRAPESMSAWCRVIATLPESRQFAMAKQLFESGAYADPPPRNAAADMLAVSELAPEESFGNWIGAWLRCRNDPRRLAYLMSGFRLASVFDPGAWFRDIRRCDDVPERELEEIGLASPERAKWLIHRLWRRCGERPGLAAVIRKSRWREFEPSAAASYFELWTSKFHYSDEAEDRRLWNALRGSIPIIESVILAAPRGYQNKVASGIRYLLQEWDDAAMVRRLLKPAILLVRRLAQQPFSCEEIDFAAIAALFELGDEDRESVLAAPDRSWQVLEKACRRDDGSLLVTRGLRAIVRQFPDLLRSTFLAAPGKLLRTAKALGVTDRPSRWRITVACRSQRLFQIDPSAESLRELCLEIRELCGADVPSPVPSRLAEWARGEIELGPARLERYRRVLCDRLLLTRLQWIEKTTSDELRRGLPIQKITRTELHALRLLAFIDDNRRALRRFLDAHWSGDTGYLANHPATGAWYRDHPRIPRNVWENGVSYDGPVRIEVEQDPLEILKLGTYVGTCLGIGGACTYSAAAVLLEANHQVLYARNPRGRVIARQIVAISDEERLVCFSVYPLNVSTMVKQAFFDYDHAFAEALGIEVNEPDAEYGMRFILADDRWDDGSWDFS